MSTIVFPPIHNLANMKQVVVLCLLFLALASCAPNCHNVTAEKQLETSSEINPSVGQMVLHIPLDTFWNFFEKPYLWPTWNYLFKQGILADFLFSFGS